MDFNSVDRLTERSKHFATIEELGSSVRKIATLLQAAIDTGAGEEEDMECLMCIARDVAEQGIATYRDWSDPNAKEEAK